MKEIRAKGREMIINLDNDLTQLVNLVLATDNIEPEHIPSMLMAIKLDIIRLLDANIKAAEKASEVVRNKFNVYSNVNEKICQ